MRNLNEETCKIRHALISDNKYGLVVLQSENWSYFIENMVEVSQGDISSLNISRVGVNIKIINDTFDNLTVCRDTYSYFFSSIGCAFESFLQATHRKYIENTEKDLALNLYFIDLKNEPNAENIMQVFAEFLLSLGDFQELLIIFLLF